MTAEMDDSAITTLAQVERYLKSAKGVNFRGTSRKGKYNWLEGIIKRFKYSVQGRKAKGLLRRYMMHMTGFSSPQLTRLITRCCRHGNLEAEPYRRNRFPLSYTRHDQELLEETDNLHGRLSGPATKSLFDRQYRIYGDTRFERLKDISVSHIYNLRESACYRAKAYTVKRTKSVQVAIGVRRKPDAYGKPGYLRVDTVHQGDLDGEKGVYHINLVDEVLQWEVVICVEAISEDHIVQTLNEALKQFPFRILGFHSDNGGEFINGRVAEILNRLLVEQTKSRSGRTNDNALVEGKNGSIIRKHMGYWHIERRHAGVINRFYADLFNEYLNYHRPCGYATITVDEKGRRRKKYETYMTPYERLKTLKKPEQYLKPGITLTDLDKIARAHSDNEFAGLMQKGKEQVLKTAIDGHKCQRKGGLAADLLRRHDNNFHAHL
jgi:transposase InsO family protein